MKNNIWSCWWWRWYKQINKINWGKSSYIVFTKKYNEYKDHERSNEEVLIERAVTTTAQILYDKGPFDNFDKPKKVLKDYLLIEVTERRRHGLGEVSNVIHGVYS